MLVASGLILAVLFLVFGLDDLLIDLIALRYRLRPRQIKAWEWQRILLKKERCLALVIPAWMEGEIIETMIRGNLSRIQYANYHIFVGIYPNDLLSLEKLEILSRRYPNVHAVISSKPGPTSKGQILNEVFRQAIKREQDLGVRFEGFLMQDAEDAIHPMSLKLVNDRLNRSEYVQIPVFSLPLGARQLVAGTYIDEFSEVHTKDLLVRAFLRAGVPSAGVGTALSRRLVMDLQILQAGDVLNERSLTEDYELGLKTSLLGYRQEFACRYYEHDGVREYIATREYFPKSLMRTIRQKTRWNLGIILQGWANLGWFGGFWQRYFLFRDRKGLVAHPLAMLGYAWTAFFLLSGLHGPSIPGALRAALALNLLFAVNRLVQKLVCVSRVYPPRTLLAYPLRWPLSNLINAAALARAVAQEIRARVTTRTHTWSKTEHEVPEILTHVFEPVIPGLPLAKSDAELKEAN